MPYAAWIPMPVIAAILFMVAYNMCEWRQFVEIVKTAPKSDILVLILTFVLTVVFDLVVAIEIGLLVTLVMFMKRMTDVTKIRSWKNDESEERFKIIPVNTEVFELEGAMFFATTDVLSEIGLKDNTKVVIIRMRNIASLDITALRAIKKIYMHFKNKGVTVLFSHTNSQPMKVMKKAGFYDLVGSNHFADNIDEALRMASKIVE